MPSLLRQVLKRIPALKGLRQAAILLAADRHSPQLLPPGHYYSPIPDLRQVRNDYNRIFAEHPRQLPGIDLNEDEQLALLEEFKTYYQDIPWRAMQTPGLRYFFDNGFYSYSDAIFLYSMIRHSRPSMIVEVGSGFSSAAILDVNRHFFKDSIRCTFVEPYPQRLLSLLSAQERSEIDLIQERAEHVDLDVFRKLSSGDILFIDSSHISKVGSDVNFLIFQVLPILASGVFVHIHDVSYPFEYPEELIMRGRAWNEAYMIRSFLLFNNAYKIVAFNTFLEEFHEEWFRREMPLCMLNKGASIWLQRK